MSSEDSYNKIAERRLGSTVVFKLKGMKFAGKTYNLVIVG